MHDSGPHDHLSRISTIWTAVRRAHGDDRSEVQIAQNLVFERYSSTIYRYLKRILRDSNAVDEVFQQFALSFVRGGFRHADPQRGRFRDYLKVSLLRLVSEFRRKRARDPIIEVNEQAEPPVLDQDLENEFVHSCRDELLSRTWQALKKLEEESGQPFHSVLQFRALNPDANSAQMAADLSKTLEAKKPLTAIAVRKTLQRARMKFSEQLVNEIIHLIDSTDRNAVEQEIIDLGLHPYCEIAFRRRFSLEQ